MVLGSSVPSSGIAVGPLDDDEAVGCMCVGCCEGDDDDADEGQIDGDGATRLESGGGDALEAIVGV